MHVVPVQDDHLPLHMAQLAAHPVSVTGLGADQDAFAESSSDESPNGRVRSGGDDDDDVDDDLLQNDGNDASSASRARRPGGAAQKRRRVTRACDECRRKKIKCDGKQPCTHCTVYSYDCTYDQPSNRRRNPAPQVVEALESRLRRAESLLRVFVPHLNMDDPGIDAMIAQASASSNSNSALPPPRFTASKLAKDKKLTPSQDADASLESMVSATGQLDIDERGYWDYHGHSSGLSFLRRMGEQFGDSFGPEKLLARSTPFARKHPPPEAIDSPRSVKSLADSPQRSTFSSGIGTTDLPPKQKALELCSDALDDAGAILRIVHQPTFYKSFNRIYDRRYDEYENEDHKFMPLLYSVMALGCLFGKDGQDVDRRGYESLTDEGYEYFWSARQLMDITDCRDLLSLQAIVFMILFLQCSAKLSTCYAYIGVALRSAIRMGLHRSFKDSFSPIESETRKRTFWAIRKMDTYVGAMLGLPLTLSDDDVDQDYPAEVDDEFITETHILPMPEGRISLVAAANANFRLARIVAKIIKDIYPIKGFQVREQNPSQVYSISYSKVRELENELQAWMESLPPIFRPGAMAEPQILRLVETQLLGCQLADLNSIQNLLRMAYAHAQILLYRPFLHYVSSKSPPAAIDQRSYACSAACISVSRNIIHITTEMKKNNLLVGSYWFTMYTTFFAILSLLFYTLENEGNPAIEDVLRDAREGRSTLASLAKRSMAADRCTATLKFMFDSLEDVMNKAQTTAKQKKQTSKKREAPTSTSVKAARSHSDVSQVGLSDVPRRASTFPSHNLPMANQVARHTNIAPRPRQSGAVPISPAPNAAAASAAAATNYYSPSMTPEPQSAGFRSHAANGQMYSAQPFLPSQTSQPVASSDMYAGSMSDLNAMMFPSTDPFVYPNPPMLTLEQNYGPNQHQNPFTMNPDQFMPASTSGAVGSVRSDDNVDVHLFGPLPGYMAQPTTPAAPQNSQFAGYDVPASMAGMAPPLTKQDSWNRQMDEILRGSDWQGQY